MHIAEQIAHPQPSRLQVWERRAREAGEVAHHAAPVTTMSSREIAELTGKEHRNVLRDIRTMLDELKINVLSFERVYFDAKNERRIEFLLPKDLTITLVSGYNVTMRHRIVTRWMELEEEAAKPAAPVVASSDPLDLLQVQAQMFPKLIAEMQGSPLRGCAGTEARSGCPGKGP